MTRSPSLPEATEMSTPPSSIDGLPDSCLAIKLPGILCRVFVATGPVAWEHLQAVAREREAQGFVGLPMLTFDELTAIARGVADAKTPAERRARTVEGVRYFAARTGAIVSTSD